MVLGSGNIGHGHCKDDVQVVVEEENPHLIPSHHLVLATSYPAHL